MIEGVLVGASSTRTGPSRAQPDAEELAGLAAALEAQFGVPIRPAAPPFLVDGAPAPTARRSAARCSSG